MKNLTLLPQDFNQHPGIYLTATLLSVIAIVFVFTMWPMLNQPVAVSNYDQCSKLPDSLIQESYPAVCVTSDGQHFTQPTPTPSPQATASSTPQP